MALGHVDYNVAKKIGLRPRKRTHRLCLSPKPESGDALVDVRVNDGTGNDTSHPLLAGD